MNNPIVTKPIPDNILLLLKKNFSSYFSLDKSLFELKLGNRNNYKNLYFTYINLEKICYAVGPGKAHLKNDFLYMEEKIPNQLDNEKPVDFSYKINEKNQEKFVGFVENKTVQNTSEATLRKEVKSACQQVWSNYISPLKMNKDNYFSSMENENNFVISICVYCPEKYLDSPYHYNNYCNDVESSVTQKMKKYGFVMLVAFVNLKQVNSAEGLELYFNNFFNKYNSNFCLVTPMIHSFQGYKQSDVYESSSNIKITTTLDRVYKIPSFNINPASQITNTRNLSNNKPQTKLTKSIFHTLLSNYKMCSDNKVCLSEIYYSLGSNARSVSFFKPQTIIISPIGAPPEGVEQRMSQMTYFITSNMSMIDGQHSSESFSFIVNMLNKNSFLELEFQQMAEEIFGKNNFDSTRYSNFRKFVCDYHIEVCIRGFSNEKTAQVAAANQNNIKKQSTVEEITNEERSKVLKIGNVPNEDSNCTYKLEVNKGIWQNEEFNIHHAVAIIPPEYLTNVAGVFSQTTGYVLANVNKLLGKNNSPTNALTNNSFRNAINWFINIDKEMDILSQEAKLIIALMEKSNEDSEFSADEIEKKIEINSKKFIFKIEGFKKSKPDKIKIIIDLSDAFKLAFKEANQEDMLKRLKQIKNILDNTHAVFVERIKKAVLIYKLTDEFNNNNKTSFLREKKLDRFYFLFNLINLLLRINFIKDSSIPESEYLENLTEADISQGFLSLNERIDKVQQYLKANNTTLFELHFAKKDMNDDLKKVLLF